MIQFSPFKGKVRPGVANSLQELSFTEVTIPVLIKQGGQIWLAHPTMMDTLAVKGKTDFRQSSPLLV